MRHRKWFFSGILFCVSLSFLIFSKSLFSPHAGSQVVQTVSALPSVAVDKSDVVLLADEQYYPYLKQYFRKARSKRNVRVSLVLEYSEENRDADEVNLEAARLLRKGGVTVRLDNSRVTTHAKVFVIDGRYCFLGSHNFTHSAMSMNKELSVMIESPDLAAEMTRYIEGIPLGNQR
jgi:phosphatidylserine/phosphatidylglycerophosphate/cardiolipin synthase-like enzyme